jgi:uncharacterized protein (DUF488 family)
MEIATIGFTRTTAETFFRRISGTGLRRLVDVRLHNRSQLAGFAKQPDLTFFLQELCEVECIEEPLLAPADEAFSAYRSKEIDWDGYASRYIATIKERRIEETLAPLFSDGAVLLCSEAEPDRCHRRLAAEYLAMCWQDVSITHL